MYSIFLSKIELSINLIKEDLIKIIPDNPKVAIFPWGFPDGSFEEGSLRYNRYINALKSLGISDITICSIKTSKEELQEIIGNSNILLLPGGNPEMFFQAVVHDTEILYDIKHFKGLIIGESAGAVLQLKRYFITAKNNYYKYFAFYDGFGVVDDKFYLDVHTINNKFYLKKLQRVADEVKTPIYAIGDTGAVIYNRIDKRIKLYGDVLVFK